MASEAVGSPKSPVVTAGPVPIIERIPDQALQFFNQRCCGKRDPHVKRMLFHINEIRDLNSFQKSVLIDR